MTAWELSYMVVLELNERDGYTVTVPALSGLVPEGTTREEALEIAKEAIACYLEGLGNDGEPFLPECRIFQGDSGGA